MYVTLQPRVAGLYTPEEMLGNALFLQEFGTVISTLLHQQLHILHYHLTTYLLAQLHPHERLYWIKVCL